MPDDRDRLLRKIVRALREPVRLGSSFDARVMRAVVDMPRHTRNSVWSRLTTPRTVTVTPLSWGVLAASLLAIVAFGAFRVADIATDAPRDNAQTSQAPGGASATAGRRVQFVLVAPTARKVAVVGDFNGWDATHADYQAKHRGGGVWSVMARVPAGHQRYTFIVDDSVWMADPAASRAADRDYGVPNSAIVVGAQEE
jgi:hypothetical protein